KISPHICGLNKRIVIIYCLLSSKIINNGPNIVVNTNAAIPIIPYLFGTHDNNKEHVDTVI
ncbi:TPA: hypothetical protein ACNRID_003642, partial [Escherichia coli]